MREFISSHENESLKYRLNVIRVKGEVFISTILKFIQYVILWHRPTDLCINVCAKFH